MIHGISEVRRLPRVGKIRLGIKATSEKTGHEFPRAVDFFVVNADQSTSEAAAAAFHKVYGDQPRVLDIMFPVEDKEQFFAQFYRRYGSGSGLLCKGDGITATEVDRGTGEIREIECNPAECEWAEKKHCRPIGTLQFILPKVPGLGIWQIDTTSYNSIININSGIDFIRALTGGRIAMIPLQLVVRPKEVQVEGKKKVVYVLDLAHENLRIEDVLRASRTSLANLLLPGVDFDEVPDDLYPRSVVEASRKAATPDKPEEPEPTTVEAEAATVEDEPKCEPEPKPQAEPGPKAAEVEAEIRQGFQVLGFTQAKQTLWRRQYKDPEALLKALREEADRVARTRAKAPAPAPAREAKSADPAPAAQKAAAGGATQRSWF